jgi:hypothetical protein
MAYGKEEGKALQTESSPEPAVNQIASRVVSEGVTPGISAHTFQRQHPNQLVLAAG